MKIPEGFVTARFNDHEFAKYLREHGAINNFAHKGNSVTWRDEAGNVIAVAFYDNASLSREIFIPQSSD